MTLATIGADGSPHAAPVYFAADACRRLYFFSDPDSQHSLDLAANPRAAAAVHPLVSGWQEIRGLQLRGRVRVVPTRRGVGTRLAALPGQVPVCGTASKDAVANTTLYVFEPEWIRLVDNRKGFGYKEERNPSTTDNRILVCFRG